MDFSESKELKLQGKWNLACRGARAHANAPPGLSDWIIPDDSHPDVRGHVYIPERIATEPGESAINNPLAVRPCNYRGRPQRVEE